MRIITAAEVESALDYASLVERLRAMFRSGCEAPVRHHHTLQMPGQQDATLLLMPAWQAGQHVGVKIVSVFPDNGKRSLPAVMGSYLLLDGSTGEPVALLDGRALTVRRTAAASALAASYLARPDASRLLIVGTGQLAPHLVRAHAAVRPVRDVAVWGRDAAKASALAEALRADGFQAEPAADLEEAVRHADIVSCATLARQPLIRGEWLSAGCHVDLVGGFTPDMREADDEAVRRSSVFVDTIAGATKEAGDIVQPIASGALRAEGIKGDLFALARDEVGGRSAADEITLFKSVGASLEDLAAAQLTVERV